MRLVINLSLWSEFMGRRKHKQAPVAAVSVPPRESKMDQVQSNVTLEATFSSENTNESKMEETTNKWFDSQPKLCDLLATPLPDTPIKPSLKKSKRENSEKNNDTSAEILEAIREFRDEMFQKISTIDKTTAVTATQIEA